MKKFFETVFLLLMLFGAIWLADRFLSCRGPSGESYHPNPPIELFPTIPFQPPGMPHS
jgi:hypothetical protein